MLRVLKDMSKIHDLTGKRFGRLVALEWVGSDLRKHRLWRCKCDCGNEKITKTTLLISNQTKSCGCLGKEVLGKSRAKDLTGKKFNRLMVIKKADRLHNHIAWKCKCDCGKEVNVITASLINGNTKSCGCLALEKVQAMRGPKHPNWNHDLSKEQREYDNLYRRSWNPEFIEWSYKIKEKDSFKCRKCLKNSKFLESHHILAWLDYPEHRYDLKNGVCLCRTCHREFHKKYGKRHFTQGNLEEFLGVDKLI